MMDCVVDGVVMVEFLEFFQVGVGNEVGFFQ